MAAQQFAEQYASITFAYS